MIQKSILLVDDEEDILDIMESILEPLQLNVAKASDGLTAFKEASETEFDLIVSDLNMPKLDGLAFLEKLRTANIKTPIIFVTGYGDRQKVYKAWKLGASDFLDKPFKEDVFLQAVKAVLAYKDGADQKTENITLASVSVELAKTKASAANLKLKDFIEGLINKA